MIDEHVRRRSYTDKTSGRRCEVLYPEPSTVMYTNNIQLKATMFDFVLELGLSIEATEERLVIKNMTSVVMSPPHAKALAKMLTNRVRKYEERFGELPDESAQLELQSPEDGDAGPDPEGGS
jgi:hypothetical protein